MNGQKAEIMSIEQCWKARSEKGTSGKVAVFYTPKDIMDMLMLADINLKEAQQIVNDIRDKLILEGTISDLYPKGIIPATAINDVLNYKQGDTVKL